MQKMWSQQINTSQLPLSGGWGSAGAGGSAGSKEISAPFQGAGGLQEHKSDIAGGSSPKQYSPHHQLYYMVEGKATLSSHFWLEF